MDIEGEILSLDIIVNHLQITPLTAQEFVIPLRSESDQTLRLTGQISKSHIKSHIELLSFRCFCFVVSCSIFETLALPGVTRRGDVASSLTALLWRISKNLTMPQLLFVIQYCVLKALVRGPARRPNRP